MTPGRRSRGPHVLAFCTVYLSLVAGVPHVFAQNGDANKGIPDLTPVTTAPAAARAGELVGPDDRAVRRVGFLNVDRHALERLVANVSDRRQKRVAIPLFDDIRVIAEFDLAEQENGGRTGLTGTIEGASIGEIIMVARDGRITANIHVSGAIYRIRPTDDGVHTVTEMDPGQYPEVPVPGRYDKREHGSGGVQRDPDDPDDLDDLEMNAEPQPDDRSDATEKSFGPDLSFSAAGGPPGGSGATIDVMVVYTRSARIAAGSTANMEDEVILGTLQHHTRPSFRSPLLKTSRT